MPVLGQGTWGMGERLDNRPDEVAALRLGLDLGMGMIDTAEMYGEGGAEEVVGEAIRGRRSEVFLVSKVYPHNASRTGVVAAAERSLRRLGTDSMDLYLLHWPGSIPLEDTVAGFETLVAAGKIGAWGVSNFDTPELDRVAALRSSTPCATDQVLYNLMRRGIEFDLLPRCRREGMPVMAYSPIEQGRLLTHPAVVAVARDLDVTPAQVALAWVLGQEGVAAIPKAANPHHVRANRAALDLRLTDFQRAALDRAFPPPRRKMPLEML
jgi:diketogulonate reductase-like aldo/keto reductase